MTNSIVISGKAHAQVPARSALEKWINTAVTQTNLPRLNPNIKMFFSAIVSSLCLLKRAQSRCFCKAAILVYRIKAQRFINLIDFALLEGASLLFLSAKPVGKSWPKLDALLTELKALLTLLLYNQLM